MGFIEYIGGIGGIAGVLAVLMFSLMKNLLRQMRDDRKYMEDKLSKIIDDYNKAANDNTKALTELIIWLRARNGSK